MTQPDDTQGGSMLTGEGDVRTAIHKRVRVGCSSCNDPATCRISFLLEGARHNPDSKGYHKDDISWCSDDEAWACDDCKSDVEHDPPTGMEWCATFSGDKFPHMILHWEHVRTNIVHGAASTKEQGEAA